MARKPVPSRAPQDLGKLKVRKPAKHAAGLKAVWYAGKKVLKEVGLFRGSKVLINLNQAQGIDCPGCAWPDPDDERSAWGEYCENGAKAIAEEATGKSIGAEFFDKHSIQDLSAYSDYQLGQLGRLREPLILHPNENHYRAISWEQAFDLIGQQLKQLESPDEAIFYTSGRTSNEAAFLYQLFVRRFGTNNLPDCSNMCHESSGVALSETLGIGKGSVTLEDFYQTDVILIMGQNPGTNHPRMLSALEKAKASGSMIITANPLPEAGLLGFRNPQKWSGLTGNTTQLTDLYLPLKINSDIALLKAIMLILWEAEQRNPGSVFDTAFIRQKTEGYSAFLDDLKNYDFQDLCRQCGLDPGLVKKAANMIIERPKMIVCWAMGLTQHENAVDTIKEIVNLLLLRGSIGKPGAGTCPVRGHSNVQGDRTMGIWERPTDGFLDKLGQAFDFEPPRKPGYSTVAAIQAMHKGDAKVFIGLGGNFHSATPDTDYTSDALQKCALTVQISTKLNRSHLVTGETALILPCLGRTDIDRQRSGPQIVSVENSMGVVHQSRGKLKPVSTQLKSEPAIIAGMAKTTLGVQWDHLIDDYDTIRNHIAEVIPGFEDYNKRLLQPNGFYLPNPAREGTFRANGKALFSVIPLQEHRLGPDEYLMMTVRSHDQFNTTIYGNDDRYRGISQERRVVLMNAEDISLAGLKERDLVDISSNYRGIQRTIHRFLVLSYPLPRGNVATYFPEANPLVPVHLMARKSHTPVSKSVRVKIEKIQG